LVAALVAGGCSAPDSIDVDPALEEVPVEQCREDPAELPAGQEFYDNLLDLSGPTTLVLEQDPEGVGDASAARLSFEGDTFLSRWSGDDAIMGTVLGNTFLGPDTGVTEAGAADCARLLSAGASTDPVRRPAPRSYRRHPPEVSCGRGCLACELAGPI
jgi:hypothetical protein